MRAVLLIALISAADARRLSVEQPEEKLQAEMPELRAAGSGKVAADAKEDRAGGTAEGDPIEMSFDVTELPGEAVSKNMVVITGAYNKKGGEQQELAYLWTEKHPNRADCQKGNGYNEAADICVYFFKKGAEFPDLKKNFPGSVSKGYVKAVGDSIHSFKIAALDGILDMELKKDGEKGNGQPIIKTNLWQYTGNALQKPIKSKVECYLRFIHQHEIDYGMVTTTPTKVQIVGVTDPQYVDKEMTANEFFNDDNIEKCGACVTIKSGWGGNTVKVYTCPSGRVTSNDFRR